MVTLRECNTLVMDGVLYSLQLHQNSGEITFQGSGGPDSLDHRKINLCFSTTTSSEGQYVGTFEIQFAQDHQSNIPKDKGELLAQPHQEAFSLFPIGVYQDRREWTLKKV